jgi:hypothetical protein
MSSLKHLNKEKAVRCFRQHFRVLARLPLITDKEMEVLFGEEVAVVLAELNEVNRRESLCARCAGGCCHMVKCEFYLPALRCCPIHAWRPILCRMHFCHRYPEGYRELIREIGDIFLDSLLADEGLDQIEARLFDCPSFGPVAPGLRQILIPRIQELGAGLAGESKILALIQAEAEKYRRES